MSPASNTDLLDSPIFRFGKWVGVCSLMAGLPIITFVLARIVAEQYETRNWPQVEGRITHATVEGNSIGQYTTIIAYDYEVAGRSFHGHRIAASDGELPNRRAAESALGGRHAGQVVAVYYNPNEPGQVRTRTRPAVSGVRTPLRAARLAGTFDLEPPLALGVVPISKRIHSTVRVGDIFRRRVDVQSVGEVCPLLGRVAWVSIATAAHGTPVSR
jgi:hypothetical protein